jgi:opacity protein-like surface antigen
MTFTRSIAHLVRGLRSTTVLAAITLAAAPALAQTGSSTWQFEGTAYLWATAMKGDVQAGALPKTSVDLSFGDILENLDFGLMGAFEARKGRLGLLFDGMYMKVSGSATASRPLPGPLPATLTVGADAKVKQGMLSGAVAYRAVEGQTSLDVIGGVRYNWIDASATIDASLFGLTGSTSRSCDKDWWDPFIGARFLHRIDDRWTFVAYADVGGFGVGSDSTWQGLIGVNYAFSKTVIGKIAYRYMSVDYDHGGFVYDMKNQGPLLGVGMRF